MARRYRRRRSEAAQVIGDTIHIANRVPWWGALLIGGFGFVLFAIALPGWIESQIAAQQDGAFAGLTEAVLGRRLHWLKWAGIACGAIGVFFAFKSAYFGGRYGREGEGVVGMVARLFGRSLD